MAKPSTLTNNFACRVRDRWFNTASVGTLIFIDDLTKQEFKNECDINYVLARYRDAPPRPWANPPTLRYGDFADAPDFLGAQLLVKQAEEQFNSIPAPVRERFGNNPANFLEWIHKPENKDEARRLGFLKAEVAPPPSPSSSSAPSQEPPLKAS